MQKKILKCASNLENYGTLINFTHSCSYKNSTCGDKVKIYLKIHKKIIKQISYVTESCLICSACCSIFSNCVKNKNIEMIHQLYTLNADINRPDGEGWDPLNKGSFS